MENITFLLSSLYLINYGPLINQLSETLNPHFTPNRWLTVSLKYDRHAIDNEFIVALLKGLERSYFPTSDCFGQVACEQQSVLQITVDKICHQYNCHDSITIKLNTTTSIAYLVEQKDDKLSIQVHEMPREPTRATVFMVDDILSYVGPDVAGEMVVFGRIGAILRDLTQFLPVRLNVLTKRYVTSRLGAQMIKPIQFHAIKAELIIPQPKIVKDMSVIRRCRLKPSK